MAVEQAPEQLWRSHMLTVSRKYELQMEKSGGWKNFDPFKELQEGQGEARGCCLGLR